MYYQNYQLTDLMRVAKQLKAKHPKDSDIIDDFMDHLPQYDASYQQRSRHIENSRQINQATKFNQTYPINYHLVHTYPLTKEDRIHQNATLLHYFDQCKRHLGIYSNPQLSQYYQLHETAFSNWYNGQNSPSMVSLLQIAERNSTTVGKMLHMKRPLKSHQYHSDVNKLWRLLNQYCQSTHITKKQLAQQIGCAQNTLRRIKNKHQWAQITVYQKISYQLNIPIDQLIYVE